MKSKEHFYISLAKSIIRIFGCLYATTTQNITIIAISFGVAEVLGILEEISDKRG